MNPVRRIGAGRPSKAELRRRIVDAMFPVARHIVEAGGDRDRAAILLRLPDAVLLQKQADLEAACELAGFAGGSQFIAIRIAALTATRDAVGALPDGSIKQLDFWRQGFAALAYGAKQ